MKENKKTKINKKDVVKLYKKLGIKKRDGELYNRSVWDMKKNKEKSIWIVSDNTTRSNNNLTDYHV